MMLVLANVLLLLAGGLGLLLVLSLRRSGPEGPVGAHMVTAPLALGQAAAVACGLAGGSVAGMGALATVVGVALPGYVVAMTIVPIAALSERWRVPVRLATVAVVAGAALVIHGNEVGPLAAWSGAAALAAMGAGGYGVLLAWWVQVERNRARAAQAEVGRMDEFRASQSAWELGEWQKLPADAELWQLIQFAHAHHPEVRAQCQARMRALPDLDRRMDELLRTGWAEHALHYVAVDYPHSRASLAAALAPFLDAECDKWAAHLRDAAMPHTWSVNLAKYVDCMRAVLADGGDLHAQAARWRTMLRSIRGLGPLADGLAA